MPSTDYSPVPDSSSSEAAPRLLRAENFEPLVGRRVQFAGTACELMLDRVERRTKHVPPGLSRAPFSLLFTSPKGDTYLQEGLYRFDFGSDAIFDIHVAPIHTPAADRQDYQAVFN